MWVRRGSKRSNRRRTGRKGLMDEWGVGDQLSDWEWGGECRKSHCQPPSALQWMNSQLASRLSLAISRGEHPWNALTLVYLLPLGTYPSTPYSKPRDTPLLHREERNTITIMIIIIIIKLIRFRHTHVHRVHRGTMGNTIILEKSKEKG